MTRLKITARGDHTVIIKINVLRLVLHQGCVETWSGVREKHTKLLGVDVQHIARMNDLRTGTDDLNNECT